MSWACCTLMHLLPISCRFGVQFVVQQINSKSNKWSNGSLSKPERRRKHSRNVHILRLARGCAPVTDTRRIRALCERPLTAAERVSERLEKEADDELSNKCESNSVNSASRNSASRLSLSAPHNRVKCPFAMIASLRRRRHTTNQPKILRRRPR